MGRVPRPARDPWSRHGPAGGPGRGRGRPPHITLRKLRKWPSGEASAEIERAKRLAETSTFSDEYLKLINVLRVVFANLKRPR